VSLVPSLSLSSPRRVTLIQLRSSPGHMKTSRGFDEANKNRCPLPSAGENNTLTSSTCHIAGGEYHDRETAGIYVGSEQEWLAWRYWILRLLTLATKSLFHPMALFLCPKYRAAGCRKLDQRIPPALELHNRVVVGVSCNSFKPDTGDIDTCSIQASEALRYCWTTTYPWSTRSGMAIGDGGWGKGCLYIAPGGL
jgi:hypothetical protein